MCMKFLVFRLQSVRGSFRSKSSASGFIFGRFSYTSFISYSVSSMREPAAMEEPPVMIEPASKTMLLMDSKMSSRKEFSTLEAKLFS